MKANYLIFGGGAVVQEYYLPALEYLNTLNQVTIIEPDFRTCQKIEKNFNVAVVQHAAEDFLKQHSVSKNTIAVVALPNHLHYPVARLCLNKRLPVLCEKPLSLLKKECLALHDEASTENIPFSAAMVRRYLPCFKMLQNIIKEKSIGNITKIEVSDGGAYAWLADSRSFFEKQNGGVLADIGIHYLDQLYALFGELFPIAYTDDAKGGVENTCSYTLKTENNVAVSLKLSRSMRFENRFIIYGEKGKAWYNKNEFDGCYVEKHGETYKINAQQPFLLAKNIRADFDSCFVEQLLHFEQAVAGQESPAVSAAEAAQTVALIEWAYARQKAPVKVIHEPVRYGVTGGSGFIGSALIERLAAQKHRLTAPMRSYRQCAQIARFDIDMPRYDLLDYNDVKKSMAGCDHIIHLAYANDGKNAGPVNIKGTQNVVRAAAELKAKSITILSTMYVYGHPNSYAPVNEQSKFSPAGGDYGRTKAEMQRWCLNFAKENPQLHLSVLNPSCVFGPNGKTYTTLPYDLAVQNRFCWVNEGSGMANVVYIDDVVDAILLAMHHPAAQAQNFILNGHCLTWKTFLQFLLPGFSELPSLNVEELKSRSFREQSSLKNMASYLLSDYDFIDLVNRHSFLGKWKRSMFNRLPMVKSVLGRGALHQTKNSIRIRNAEPEFNPPVWLADLFGPTNTQFSSAKAQKLLGWQPRPFDVTMQNTLNWLKEHYGL